MYQNKSPPNVVEEFHEEQKAMSATAQKDRSLVWAALLGKSFQSYRSHFNFQIYVSRFGIETGVLYQHTEVFLICLQRPETLQESVFQFSSQIFITAF